MPLIVNDLVLISDDVLASTALDYAKSLRILTDLYQVATFVSLYQAGDQVFEQFDKLLLIDEGRQIYYGPINEARNYLVSLGYRDLPRQSHADYVTGCTDPNERQIQDGKSIEDVPSTSAALAEAYLASDIAKRMNVEREQFEAKVEKDNKAEQEFREAILEDKHKFVSKKSIYSVSFFSQVWALTVRQAQLRAMDRLDLIVSFSTTIIVALISGSVYFKLPETSQGAFTRGGVIFIALLFNSFQAFNELPTQMLGRAIIWKHRGFGFYRP